MKPYPPFVAVTLKQPVFNYENVSGTLIGDFGPDLFRARKKGAFKIYS